MNPINLLNPIKNLIIRGNMTKKFAINGYCNVGGQQRMVFEMLRELDKWIEPDLIQIVIPHNYICKEHYSNIEIIRFGCGNKIFWIQTCFFLYLIKSHRIGINLYNACPVLRPDVMTIYDLTSEICKKEQCSNLHGKLSYLYSKSMRFRAIKKSKLIYTASNTSKKELMDYYHVDGKQFVVLEDGWQHMLRIREDDSIFFRYPQLIKNKYYLSLGSLLPHKNFKWVIQVSKRNKNQMFVIVGEKVGYKKAVEKHKSDNLVYLGKITDGEMKALMKNCKAFIHPALSEGFGIPPLEALSVGAPIIVSNTSCLPEIYENSAHYINPKLYNVDLDNLINEPVESADKILNKYSWKKVAEKFYNSLIKTFECEK